MDDAARFLPDDPEALVTAAFMCPVCLCRASYVRLSGMSEEPAAECACLACSRGWKVGLTDMQMLRLTLGPPRGLTIERGGRTFPSAELPPTGG